MLYSRVRPHVREPRRREQRDFHSSRTVQSREPLAAVPLHVPSGAGAARARPIPHLRLAGQAARVCATLLYFYQIKSGLTSQLPVQLQ